VSTDGHGQWRGTTGAAILGEMAASAPLPVPPRADLFHAVWASRELLAQITRRDIRIRYTQAIMGFGWAVLMPLLIVGGGLLVRHAMAYVAGSQLEATAVLGMAVKALPWAFFVGAIGFATTSLSGNYQLITKVAFPRIVLPISAVLTQAFDTTIGIAALALLSPLLGAHPSPAWLWILPLALLAFLLTSATCVFLACANLFFRDVKYLVQIFVTFGIFFTPVFFEPAMFGETGARLLWLNPLSAVLEGLRLCIVDGHGLLDTLRVADAHGVLVLVWSPWCLGYALAVAIVTSVSSIFLFQRLEPLFAEYA
jgi:lipopolysaccharide transport system permease protein